MSTATTEPRGAETPAAAPVQANAERMTAGKYTMNILNALALGTVLALIPGALLGEISKAILRAAPSLTWLTWIINATAMASSMLGLIVGVLAAQAFKLSPIAQGSIGLATMFAGGAVTFGEKGAMTLKGTGDVINVGLTAALAVGVVLLLQKLIPNLKTYAILIVPAAVLIIAGIIGRLILPFVMLITTWIGKGVAGLLGLTPALMVMVLAVVFGILIVSPVTSVGIALAISLAGIGSGAGNIGICAVGFGLAIAGWRVNSKGVSLAHFIGSPKMSMPNVLKKPKILLPMLCSAALSGLLAWVLHITGTPMSAGFGFSGLVGPLAYLGNEGWTAINLLKALVAFVVAPAGLSFLFQKLFTRIGFVRDEDYKLDIA